MSFLCQRTPGRGVTLIMVAGVLAVLAALGAGFYTLMTAQMHSTLRYSDTISADLAMKAGLADAIGRLREDVFYHTEDPGSGWYSYDYLHGALRKLSFAEKNPQSKTAFDYYFPFSRALSNKAALNSEQFSLTIVDAASKINVNSGDGLAVILDNLCRVLGTPLVAADPDALQPRCWSSYGAAGGLFDNAKNSKDNNSKTSWDLYYPLDMNHDGRDDLSGAAMPLKADGTALYGDGYAIAAYRSKHGLFKTIFEVRDALTYTLNPQHPELEQLELDVKFNALKNFITIDSWIDTSTVCTGKFEWVNSSGSSLKCMDPDDTSNTLAATSKACQVFIDRDKSWVADDPANDPKNLRGSLRGCYLTIVNGHGAGQLRRIATNGIDWVAIKLDQKMDVEPGPVSSYMIVAREEALRDKISAPTSPSGTATIPREKNGRLVADSNIDYSQHPLCIHRAPVNVNTASDKVLTALFMGIDIQHGHPMAVGTDADLKLTTNTWKLNDPHDQEAYVLTPKGLKRIPVSSGRLILDRPNPWKKADDNNFNYIGNYGSLNASNFKVSGAAKLNEAHELAWRVISARTRTKAVGTPDPDPNTADAGGGMAPYNGSFNGFERGPFKSWDDLYFRVVKPWDDIRSGYFISKKSTIPNSGQPGISMGLNKASVARLIMANFNPNTDLLKFNPNIEWIDRWGRNFTDMEAVMAYTNDAPTKQPGDRWTDPAVANPLTDTSKPIYAVDSSSNNARGQVFLMPDNLDNLKDDSDPNAGTYVIRSFRYRSDEMIDKSDLNRSTTEFAFDSKGVFEIEVLGRVVKGGETEAERRCEALVKIYDVWRETTQSQFVQGRIQVGGAAPACKAGTTYAGQITRDGFNNNQLLPLVTMPEPLVPANYKLVNTKGLNNKEEVDKNKFMRDAYGTPKIDPTMPDVVANHVLPAVYDGQIVLATNTLGFDPSTGGDADTFLASFNGDLDTDTCLGNGREQAKMPHTAANDGYKYRVVDTCSVLGLMNDTLVDIDTDLPAGPNWTTNVASWDGWSEPPKGPRPGVYRFAVLSDCLKALNKNNYWENVTLRQGDLRPDGVFLTSPGVSGNEATLKYCFGDDSTSCQDSETPGKAKLNFNPGSKDGNLVTMWMKPTWHHNDHYTHPFFDATNPGYSEGGTSCRAFYLKKHGSTVWALDKTGTGAAYVSGNRRRVDDLNFSMEGNCLQPSTQLPPDQLDNQNPGRLKIPGQTDNYRDLDMLTNLHGGVNWVPRQFLYHDPANTNVKAGQYAPASGGHEEAPSYRVQPFRWGYVGMRWRFHADPGLNGNGDGHWVSSDTAMPQATGIVSKMAHPFISTQTEPEMASGLDATKFNRQYWASLPNSHSPTHGFDAPCDTGDTGFVNSNGKGTKTGDSRYWLPNPVLDPIHNPTRHKNPNWETESGFGVTGQPCKWKWADPAGVEDPFNKVFGVNNLNQDITTWIYHHLPQDGTYAVIDELKISSREYVLKDANWRRDRAVREQTLSRYYMPSNPDYKDACPTFTSQTMLESLKGVGATAAADYVTLARVSWTVFTPRFVHENLRLVRERQEWISRDKTTQNLEKNNFRGPFDYDKYNEVYYARETGDIFPYGVDRPTPQDYNESTNAYTQPHYSRGVEVEVLNGTAPVAGSTETFPASGVYSDAPGGTFSNPELINRFVDKSGKPIPSAYVKTSNLRYRVRFRYPVDQLVDPGAGKKDGKMFWADATQHYLLDTPVFDDISVTYFITPQILYYKELLE